MQFGRHESFHLRSAWVYQGLNSIANNSKFFSQKDAHCQIGVGRNMVNAIRYWCQAFELIEAINPRKMGDGFVLTSLGRVILEMDPYLEDPFTEWILHYHLCTNLQAAPSFYWLFQDYAAKELIESKFVENMLDYLKKEHPETKEPSEKIVSRDFKVIIKTYCNDLDEISKSSTGEIDVQDSPFSHLNLIHKVDGGHRILMNIGPKLNLTPDAVAYAILKQSETDFRFKRNLSVGIEKLLWQNKGPGKCFNLDAESLLSHLEQIAASKLLGKMEINSTGGIHQVLLNTKKVIDPLDLLKAHYEGVLSEAC